MNKILVLDVDGVLIRDQHVLHEVKRRCEAYVAKKLPGCDAVETNARLYLSHGHTAKGLRDVHGINTTDFNSFVYQNRVFNCLYEVIYGTDFQRDATQIHELISEGWKVTLFSNAPYEWTHAVAFAISDEVGVTCFQGVKPEPVAYTSFPKAVTKMYVDDSLKNLGSVRWEPNWHPVHFSCSDEFDHPMWCPQAGSIDDILCLARNISLPPDI